MDLISHLITFVTLLSLGVCFDQDRSVILSEGDTTALPCTMDGVNLQDIVQGRAAASWRKYQQDEGESNPESLSLNNGAAVRTDLPQSLKAVITFENKYDGDQPPINLQLTLSNVRRAESGKYTCSIQKNGDNVHTVTYVVQVLTKMNEVILYSAMDSSAVGLSPNSSLWSHTPTISIGTKNNGYLACVARGGYPIPTLQVTIGQRSITGLMRIRQETISLIGTVDFQREYSATRFIATNNFPVDLNEDGATVKCTALIEDSKNQEFHKLEATGTLSLRSKPTFVNCSQTFATPLGSKDFELVCQFIAKPSPTLVQWTGETSGDIVRRTTGSDGPYVASMRSKGNNLFEGVLKIKSVEMKDFQRYKLTAGNQEGSSDFTITLNQGTADPSTQGSSANLASIVTILVATLLAALVQ